MLMQWQQEFSSSAAGQQAKDLQGGLPYRSHYTGLLHLQSVKAEHN